MSQLLQANVNDMNTLEQIEEKVSNFELSIQKAISLTALHISKQEAFEEVFSLLDEMNDLFKEIQGQDVRLIAMYKIKEAMEFLESKVKQIY